MKREADIQESVKGHEARNAQLLRTLRSKGMVLSERHPAEHHFWAYSREMAEALADELRKRGYIGPTIGSHKFDDGSNLWSVEASFEQTLEEAASRGTTEELVRLAARFDALYDGWGVSI